MLELERANTVSERQHTISEEWPEVPSELRPKELPHEGQWPEEYLEVLKKRGYKPVDVRLCSGPDAVRLCLEGGRLGTVVIDRGQLAVLELEARVYGLTQNNRNAGMGAKKVLDDKTQKALFDFFGAKSRYDKGTSSLPDPKQIKKKSGRKKWSVDKNPRDMEAALSNLKKAGEAANAKRAKRKRETSGDQRGGDISPDSDSTRED